MGIYNHNGRYFIVHLELQVKIPLAADKAQKFFETVTVEDLKGLEPFTFASRVDGEVAELVHYYIKGAFSHASGTNHLAPWEVLPWKPFNPWTSAIGTTFSSKPGIYLNVRKIAQRQVADYVNTLVHEAMHKLGFGHGSNKVTREKLRSVPYAVGALAEQWVREGRI
jgi:hypothetical protein